MLDAENAGQGVIAELAGAKQRQRDARRERQEALHRPQR